MTVCHLDIESFSEADLQREGLYRYAADPSTDLLVVCYAFDDEPVQTWIPAQRPIPDNLRVHIARGGQVRAHNAAFERIVLNGPAGQRYGVPPLKIEQMVCTMAKMAAHGLPHGLENAAEALGTHPKSKTGRTDMLYLCKPRADGTRPTPQEEPERFLRLYSYCVDDVEAERGIDRVVPDLSPNEQKVYELDQRMNDRGWKVDLESIGNAQFLIDQYKAELAGECKRITGTDPFTGVVDPKLRISITQTGKLADWVRDHGYPQLTDLQVGTVNAAVLDPNCPAEVKKVLNLFSTHNMKAVTKYTSMARAAGADGRLRGMFQFLGASTGRWSSKITQLQNLYRPKIDDPETAVEAFRQRDLRWLRELYDVGPMKVLASCVRSVLVAEEGHDLLFLDYAAIEARVNAWLWGEHWKLDAYRAYDAGTGPDLYKLAYARSFRVPIDSVTKASRQIGKVLELSMGYEGGVGAFVKMAKTYDLDLAEVTKTAYANLPLEVREEAHGAWDWAVDQKRTQGLDQKTYVVCDALKRLWRNAHPGIAGGWRGLTDAAVQAITNPGQVFAAAGKKIMFKVEDQWLYMRLPSGRRLAYFKPQYDESNGKISYMGVDTFTRRWQRTETYGGKFCENAVQAISRDLLVAAKFKLERAGYPIIGSVHDEAILEPSEGFGWYDDAAAIMCDSPKWAAGLPVAVEGHRTKRYRK